MGAATAEVRDGLRAELRANARRLYFSAEAVDAFIGEAPLAQVRAVR